jgi:hypothetical protein
LFRFPLILSGKSSQEDYMKVTVWGTVLALTVLSTLALTPVHANGEGQGEKKIFTKHFQETLFDITRKASFSIEILLDDKEYDIGKNVIGIVVHDSDDKDVKGVDLTFSYKNLETGEKAPDKPVIDDKGNGLYIISGLDLEKEGRWELGISLKKDDVEDRVSFILPDALKKRHPKGRYSP